MKLENNLELEALTSAVNDIIDVVNYLNMKRGHDKFGTEVDMYLKLHGCLSYLNNILFSASMKLRKETPKDCPFCGCKMYVNEIDRNKFELCSNIHSDGCPCETLRIYSYESKQELINRWNNRKGE